MAFAQGGLRRTSMVKSIIRSIESHHRRSEQIRTDSWGFRGATGLVARRAHSRWAYHTEMTGPRRYSIQL